MSSFFVRRFFFMCMISCPFIFINGQTKENLNREHFLDRQLHLIGGASFSSRVGLELSATYFHEKGWLLFLRSWDRGYDTPEYPAPGPGQYGREWPYEYFELSLQVGKWKALPHNFFLFATTGFGYANDQYPIGRDSTDFGTGIYMYQNVTTQCRALGWMSAAAVGWRKYRWGAVIIPGFSLSRAKTTGSISVALILALKVGRKLRESAEY